jgi:hypothetical protein
MKLWIKVAIIAALALGTLRISAPPPTDGYSSFNAGWTHQTVEAYGGVWFIAQTDSFTIHYVAGQATYLSLNWSYCKVDAMFITIAVDWCGATRMSATKFDSGFNFVKTSFWLLGQQSCWVRATVDASGPWNGSFPALYVAPTRNGC